MAGNEIIDIALDADASRCYATSAWSDNTLIEVASLQIRIMVLGISNWYQAARRFEWQREGGRGIR